MRVYPELTVDGEFKALGDLGHRGSLNDRQFSFLRAAGYTNGLADMFRQRSFASAFNPISLFSASEPGAWYDPSDLSTMFQDTAGTVAVTAPGQPVARINDKSGRGNHATQGTAGSRPLYGIIAATGQRNQLSYSNDFTNTGAWTNGSLSVTLNADGAAQKLVPTANGVSFFGRSATFGVLNGTQYTLSARMKAAGKRYAFLQINLGTRSSAFTFDLQTATVGNAIILSGLAIPSASQAITLQADGYCRVSVTFTTNLTSLNVFGGMSDSLTSRDTTVNGTDGIFVRNAQFELGATPTTEQTVVTYAEITEAGVDSLPHLYFDGVDDQLISSTITAGTNKAQVFVAATKIGGGGGFPSIIEYGVNPPFTDGSWAICSQLDFVEKYLFEMRNSSLSSNRTSNLTYPSFSTAVLSSLMDASIAGAGQLTARINTSENTTFAGGAGTGNFGNHAIYIGRRSSGLLPFAGRNFGSIVRFGNTLDAGTVTQVENWLNNKARAYV